METDQFVDNARGLKAQRLARYIIHLGIKSVDDWGPLEWKVIAEGASEFHGVKVHPPSDREPRTTHKMIAEHIRGYWKREALQSARSSRS